MIIHPEIEEVSQPGYIYLAKTETVGFKEYKIGKTRNIRNRMSTLQAQTGLKVTLIAYSRVLDAAVCERHIQDKYSGNCIHGEYFQFSNGELYSVIKSLDFGCGIETDFTDPVCHNDGNKLIIRKRHFECPSCRYRVSFDQYMAEPQRMLPYHCDDMNDDDRFIYYKHQNIYSGGIYV